MICPSCHKVCRPRAKFCNHCLQSFAGLSVCDICNSLNPTGQACSQCEQKTIAEASAVASAAVGTVTPSQSPFTQPTATSPRSRLLLGGLVVLLALGYAWFSLGNGAWTRAGMAAAASASAAAEAAAKAAAAPPSPRVMDSEMITELKDPEPAPRPVVVKRTLPPAPAPVASTAAPAPPEVKAPPAPEPAPVAKPAPRAKTVDEVFSERLSAECSGGLGGVVCREKLRFVVCADRWSQSPPPGQTICRGTPTN